jgi:hypothetical protein
VIVIFASSYDTSAASLAAKWAANNASLLTCDDLSRSGWRHYLGSQETSTAVISSRVVPVAEITGVLIRWPGVFAQELIQIDDADRNYVAGEMTAFLISWLTNLSCPVINRPTPLNLTGPAWRTEQWTYAASRLGIPVHTVHRHVGNNANQPRAEDLFSNPASVTVVGERCFGNVDEDLFRQARCLAEAANVSVLKVYFSGPEPGAFLAGTDLIPDLTDEVADAVLELLLREAVT